jgi:response regulator RpfG family c-di-GMP phosphodiesterase
MINLSGRRILIVEDEMLIALLMQDFLEALGCVVVGIALQAPQASKLIESNPGAVDAAILESSRKHEASHEIAAMLDARGIPFIVTTGYDDAEHLAGFGNRPMVRKPYQQSDVAHALGLLTWRDVKDSDRRNCLGQAGARATGR